jgi:hypothetical protein
MWKIAVLPLIGMLLASTCCTSAAECTYDQSEQLKKLQSIAATKANARFIAGDRQVTWIGRDGTHWSLVYGGCAHLEFAVTSSRVRKLSAKRDEVLQAAERIASEFWYPVDATDLRAAIATEKFEARTDGAVTHFTVEHESYDVFEVEHEFNERVERITVRWVRSF